MCANELPKKYDSKVEEAKIMDFWENNNIFTFELVKKKPFFGIDTPPPTVSGNMHIGHSASYSQEDFIARYKRLRGFNVFYPFGTDDNGLPTERLVEKKKKVSSTRMDGKEFRDLCFNTISEIKEDFIYDWKRLGISCDYSKSYSTISPEVQKISQESFIELYNKSLIYEQEAPMTWCTKCQTAIAQAEFESKEFKSYFNDIIFKSVDGDDLIISTTRPEFLPACVALFANPQDKRYTHLKGKSAKVPIFDLEVPIMFDENVAMDKGTGLMMVCTFGDKEDVDKWKRYNLPLRIIFTKFGTMNKLTGKYEGMKIKDARDAIIEELKEKKLLISQKEIVHALNVHDKCGTELEFLKTKQWFIKVLDFKEELLNQVDKLNWYPKHMKHRMIHWIENLNWDWCISRQRSFGIPFPVWRDKKFGKIILPRKEDLPVDPLKDLPEGYKRSEVIAETDVMDTWATSSLSPIIALKSYGLDIDNYMPLNLRPQAHDIIRTWAFYTMIREYYQNKKVPWNDILISGFISSSLGEKMSKSKGNVVSPREILEKYSSDILRFWAAGQKLGEDLPYKEQDLDAGKKLVTKLWNSFKFLNLFIEKEVKFNPNKKPKKLFTIDKWILDKLNQLIKENTKNFDNYEYDKVKLKTEQFFWQTFCDNYIELVKDRLYNVEKYEKGAKESGLYTFYHALKAIVVMFNPITPFVTESIWQYFFVNYEKEKSISYTNWPELFDININDVEKYAGDLSCLITSKIRQYKSNNSKPLNSLINIKIYCDDTIKKQLDLVLLDIKGTAKIENASFVTKNKIKEDIVLYEEEKKDTEFFAIDVDFL